MEEFRCIGADCEDNCCYEWTVLVDQSTHQRLKKALPAERFVHLRLLPVAQRTREAFAEIAEATRGDCPMLDEQRLCVIQGRHGESLLPEVCSTYPRLVSVVGAREEMTGSLSCPEVARRALLSPGAVELFEALPALFAAVRAKRMPELDDAYRSQLDEIRGTLYQLFGLDGHPLATRLYFAMMLGERVGDYFHEDASEVPLGRLREEIAAIETPALRQALAERFRALPAESELAVSLLAQALAARIATQKVSRIVKLVSDTFAEYGISASGEGLQMDAKALAKSYGERWQRLRERHGERIEAWLQNYAQHYVFHEWYCESPTLALYVQTLALNLGLIRFLLAAHPLAGEEPEKALVHVVYTLARAIDHSPNFVEALAKVMREKLGPSTTVALLKL
jgi:lysine-N-methylase